MVKHPYWQRPLTGAPHSLISFLLVALLFLLILLALPPSLSPQGRIVPHNKVTSVIVSVLSSNFIENDTKIRVEFSARINANSYGRVDYRWVRSDGGRGQREEINFSAAGTMTVTTSWTMGAPAAGREVWEAVEIIYPNGLTSNKATYTVPSPSFKVVDILNSVSPTTWNGPCPKTFQITSQIKAVGKGTAKYRWIRSDGGKSDLRDLVFEGSETKTVTTSWTVSSLNDWEGHTHWVTAEVTYPNHILPPPNYNIATEPLRDAVAFGFKCSGYTDNPNIPVKIAVSVSGTGVDPNYHCGAGTNTWRKDEMWFSGDVTFRNLCSRPLTFREQVNSGTNSYLFIAVLFPKRKEAIGTTPTWPFVYNDPNWFGYELWYPDTVTPNGQFNTALTRCYPFYDKHPIIYVGAIYADKATGNKTASNLVKWETRLKRRGPPYTLSSFSPSPY